MAQIIGIDPGINYTGVCVLNSDRTVQAVELIERKVQKLSANIRIQKGAISYFLDENTTAPFISLVVVLEMPRIYPQSKSRDNDILDLAAMAGALAGATYGDLVYPRTWKGTTPKKIHNERILNALPDLRGFLSPYPKGKWEHIIDAAGIALWALERKAR